MSNFWQAIEHHQGHVPRKSYEYRLYHHEDGSVRCYSTQELEGDYVVIDQDTFAQHRYDVIVRDGRVYNPHRVKQHRKLVPSSTGTETSADDVTVIGQGQHWEMRYYD